MASGTREDLIREARDAFLSIRVLSGGFAPALDVVAMAIEEAWPRLGRISAKRFASFFKRRVIQAGKLVRDLRLYLPVDLSSQIGTHFESVRLQSSERRAALLAWWARVPAEDRRLIETRYRESQAIEHSRELDRLSRLLLELLHFLDQAAPIPNCPACEADEFDLARLILQRENGSASEESQIVLETLLVGEQGSQHLYVRFMSVIAEFEWLLGPKPDWQNMEIPENMTLQEKLVTWAFFGACLIAIVCVMYAIRTRLVS